MLETTHLNRSRTFDAGENALLDQIDEKLRTRTQRGEVFYAARILRDGDNNAVGAEYIAFPTRANNEAEFLFRRHVVDMGGRELLRSVSEGGHMALSCGSGTSKTNWSI